MIVVADATPLNVLARMRLVDALPALYGKVIIPPAVRDELIKDTTPKLVREWIASSPPWLEVKSPAEQDTGTLAGRGERQAIALAKELKADRLLVDDDKARKRAAQAGIKLNWHTGTASGICC